MTNISKSTGMTLAVLSILLAGQNAEAAWNAGYVGNPPEQAYPWSAIPVGAGGVILFARSIATGALLEGDQNNGSWHFSPIYSATQVWTVSASYSPVPVNQLLDTYYVAHLDADGPNEDGQMRLTMWSLFTGWTTTPPFDTGANLNGPTPTIATLVDSGILHIFYTSSNGALKVATYNGQFTLQTLDGFAGPDGQVAGNMYQPTAVHAVDGFHVYYRDHSHDTLREAYSPDGVNWTKFQTVDGAGVVEGLRTMLTFCRPQSSTLTTTRLTSSTQIYRNLNCALRSEAWATWVRGATLKWTISTT